MNFLWIILCCMVVELRGDNITVIVNKECSYLLGDDVLEKCATDCYCNLCIYDFYKDGVRHTDYLCHSNKCSCPAEYQRCVKELNPWKCTGNPSILDKSMVIVFILIASLLIVSVVYFVICETKYTRTNQQQNV